MPKRALVLIDVQNDYFPRGKWPLSDIKSAADNAAKLLAAARAAGDLVVHVQHEFPYADAPFFAPGSDGAKIHAKVCGRDGEPVEFAGTVVPAADVHAAFMAALSFGYAKLVATEEYIAGKTGQ